MRFKEEKNMRIPQKHLFVLLVLLPAFLLAFMHAQDRDEVRFRWDLIHIGAFSPKVTGFEGGSDSALAQDGSKITLTGKGTFKVGGDSEDVTGGGAWETFSSAGASTGSGTYKVKRLLRFEPAPGFQSTNVIDNIGNGTLADNQAGLAFFALRFSDGSRGVLAVSCHLNGGPAVVNGVLTPPGTPASVFEGITVSKAFTNYWNHVGPVGGVDGGRTLFHVLPEGADEE
jgi:hypothetical protein